jgi:hypothetical protein
MVVPVVVRGPVLVRPAPASDPPYDDESPPEWWGAGALQPLLELPAPAPEPIAGRARSPAPHVGTSPSTAAAATRFVNTCLEILNGYRPATHIRGLAYPLDAPAVLAETQRAVRRLRQAAGRDTLLKVRTMRTCEPRPGVAEIAVVVGTDPPTRIRTTLRTQSTPVVRHAAAASPQAWALAYRLEQRHARWLCTAAHLL